jgi:hypothetical protein
MNIVQAGGYLDGQIFMEIWSDPGFVQSQFALVDGLFYAWDHQIISSQRCYPWDRRLSVTLAQRPGGEIHART